MNNFKFQISNFKFYAALANLFWFTFFELTAIVVLKANAILGLTFAILGGIAFGILTARAVKLR